MVSLEGMINRRDIAHWLVLQRPICGHEYLQPCCPTVMIITNFLASNHICERIMGTKPLVANSQVSFELAIDGAASALRTKSNTYYTLEVGRPLPNSLKAVKLSLVNTKSCDGY